MAHDDAEPPSVGALCRRKDFLDRDVDARAQQHRTYYYRQDVDDGIDACSRKLASNPGSAKVLKRRGELYAKKGDFGRAVVDFDLVLRAAPADVDGLFGRGGAHDKLDQLDQAIRDYSQVLLLQPDHVPAAYARGACQNRKGNFAEAIEDYVQALTKDESGGGAGGGGGGEARSGGGGPPVAAAGGTPSTAERPADGGPAPEAGEQPRLSSRGTRARDARGTRRRASRRVDSRHPAEDIVFAAAEAAAAAGGGQGNRISLDGAIQGDRRARPHCDHRQQPQQPLPPQQKSPQPPQPQPPVGSRGQSVADRHHEKGFAARQRGDFRTAIEQYSRAIEAEPTHFKAHFNRAFAFDKVGEFAHAVADYTAAIRLEPGNAYAHYNLGIVHDRDGNLQAIVPACRCRTYCTSAAAFGFLQNARPARALWQELND